MNMLNMIHVHFKWNISAILTRQEVVGKIEIDCLDKLIWAACLR